MPPRKYTKEMLQQAAERSVSVMDMMRNLGLSVLSGGSHSYLSSLIKRYDIDTTHFTGQGSNCGTRHKGGPEYRTPDKVFLLRTSGGRRKAIVLRRALIESGRTYCCFVCGLTSWQGRELVLEIEHKNGNPLDDRAENLEFICPNCHSQTDTYCRTNRVISDVSSSIQ